MRPPIQRFRALNGLRFFAAVAVVLFHYAPRCNGFDSLPLFLQSCVGAGTIGVGFFYALSGFVLAHAYHNRAPHTSAGRQLFWFARAARLYPVYLVAFILFLPMAYEKYLHHPASGMNGPQTFTLSGILGLIALQAWTPLATAWNGPSWSLSVEAFFYLIFPFVLLPINRAPWRWLLPFLAFLWIVPIALTVGVEVGRIPVRFFNDWVIYNPLFWCPLFLIGIAAHRWSNYWTAISARSAFWIGAASLCTLVLLCGLMPFTIAEVLINGGALPIMLLMILSLSHPTSVMSRMMGTTILYEVGAASYIIYILQSPLWHYFYVVVSGLRPGTAPQLLASRLFFVYFAFLIGMSLAVRALVERPAQKWLLAQHFFREKDLHETQFGEESVVAPPS